MDGKQYLALDFDGVIADSILECLVTAHNAYSAFKDSEDFRMDVSQFAGDDIAGFRAARIFIRRGEDYVFLRLAADHNHSLQSQEDFDTYLEIHEEKREVFRELFYDMRAMLQSSNLEEWLLLNPIYPEMETLLKQLKISNDTYIVTTKDLISAQLILDSRGIKLDPSHMFQATKTLRKPEILKNIVKAEGLHPKQLHFIDDHPATVLEVAENTESPSYCAAWGYNTQAQFGRLEQSGIQILDMDGFQGLVRTLKMTTN